MFLLSIQIQLPLFSTPFNGKLGSCGRKLKSHTYENLEMFYAALEVGNGHNLFCPF